MTDRNRHVSAAPPRWTAARGAVAAVVATVLTAGLSGCGDPDGGGGGGGGYVTQLTASVGTAASQ